MQFDTEIDAEDQERQVETDTYTVTPRYLFVELIPQEYAARLRLIVANGPYVSCIEESSQLQERDHLEAILEVSIQVYISGLQVIDHRTACTAECSRSECTRLPSSYTVCTSGEITFFKGHCLGVQVRNRHSHTEMVNQLMLRREDLVVGDIEIALGVLRKRNLPQHVRSVFVLLHLSHRTHGVQGVSGCLNAQGELQIRAVGIALIVGGVVARITPVDDEMVFVAGLQYRRAVDELLLEFSRHPRQVDIADIQHIEMVCPLGVRSARDSVLQTCVHYRSRIFIRALLVVVRHIHSHLAGKQQSGLSLRLDSTSAVSTPFVRSTSAQRQLFCAVENIAVGIVDTRSHSPVAGAVGSSHFGRDRVDTSTGDGDVAVQQRITHRRKRYIHVLDRTQGVHSRISALHAPLGVHIPLAQTTRATQNILAQKSFADPAILVTKLVKFASQVGAVRQTRRIVVYLVVHIANTVSRV